MPLSSERLIADLALGRLPPVGVRIVTTSPIDRAKPTIDLQLLAVGETPHGLAGLRGTPNPPITLTPSERTRWHGYTIELYGFADATVRDDNPWALWHFADPDGPTLTVQIWRARVRYKGSNVSGQLLWLPTRGEDESFQIVGPYPYQDDDLLRARRGIDLLRHIDQTRRNEERRQAARDRLSVAIEQLVARNTKLSRGALAEVLMCTEENVDKLCQQAGWARKDLEERWKHYKFLQLFR